MKTCRQIKVAWFNDLLSTHGNKNYIFFSHLLCCTGVGSPPLQTFLSGHASVRLTVRRHAFEGITWLLAQRFHLYILKHLQGRTEPVWADLTWTEEIIHCELNFTFSHMQEVIGKVDIFFLHHGALTPTAQMTGKGVERQMAYSEPPEHPFLWDIFCYSCDDPCTEALLCPCLSVLAALVVLCRRCWMEGRQPMSYTWARYAQPTNRSASLCLSVPGRQEAAFCQLNLLLLWLIYVFFPPLNELVSSLQTCRLLLPRVVQVGIPSWKFPATPTPDFTDINGD